MAVDTATSVNTVIEDRALPLLDASAQLCVNELLTWARDNASRFDVQLRDGRVRRWQSTEDPDWVDVVIDLYITGGEMDGQRFWEAASTALGQIAGVGSQLPVELLWVRLIHADAQ